MILKILLRLRRYLLPLLYYFYVPKNGLNRNKRDFPEVIISLTSFPARLPYVNLCIKSLLNQKEKPDRIILYLGEDTTVTNIPRRLKQLTVHGLSISMQTDDLKPHKKYYYAMQSFPNAIVITVDDDVIYDRNLVKDLLSSYRKYPESVSARNVRKIQFDCEHIIASYSKWKLVRSRNNIPTNDQVAIGIGGILYPPYCFNKLAFDKNKIKELCLKADDLWLKTMELIDERKIVFVYSPYFVPVQLKKAEKITLQEENTVLGRNDEYIKQLKKVFGMWSYDSLNQ